MVALVYRAVAAALAVGIVLVVGFVVVQLHLQTAEIVATSRKCKQIYTILLSSFATMRINTKSCTIPRAISIGIHIKVISKQPATKSDAIYFTNTNWLFCAFMYLMTDWVNRCEDGYMMVCCVSLTIFVIYVRLIEHFEWWKMEF